jgi:hypothetical protein
MIVKLDVVVTFGEPSLKPLTNIYRTLNLLGPPIADKLFFKL